MSKPTKPDTIVIKNRYYSKGLKEIDIWNYYQKVKSSLLKETYGKDIMMFLAVDVNKMIVKRKEGNKQLGLYNATFDRIVSGRSISFHSTMKNFDDIAVIDIDADIIDKAKIATIDVFNFIQNVPLVKNTTVRFTGKKSFHVVCNLKTRIDVNKMRHYFENVLNNSDLSKKYLINKRRNSRVVNLDLSPMKVKGTYITLHSLSVIGLKCVEVIPQNIMRFDPMRVRI